MMVELVVGTVHCQPDLNGVISHMLMDHELTRVRSNNIVCWSMNCPCNESRWCEFLGLAGCCTCVVLVMC